MLFVISALVHSTEVINKLSDDHLLEIVADHMVYRCGLKHTNRYGSNGFVHKNNDCSKIYRMEQSAI